MQEGGDGEGLGTGRGALLAAAGAGDGSGGQGAGLQDLRKRASLDQERAPLPEMEDLDRGICWIAQTSAGPSGRGLWTGRRTARL
ncbi:unnamed protein product [Gadus morhua 'NCC']